MTNTTTTTTTSNDRDASNSVAKPLPLSNSSTKKALSYFEDKLKKARLELGKAKVAEAKRAKREQRTRERELGRIMLQLIEEGQIDSSVVEMLRDEVKKSCRKSHQIAAFAHTVFA